jgi:predicted  nucleic acid-binding Zn-ribbon protein
VNKLAMASLEDVQDGIDSLVLAFFESVRGHNNNNNNSSSSGVTIEHLYEQYQKTIDLADQLIGGNRTAQEQVNEIESLQAEISEVKGSISSLEEKLQDIDNRCTSELKAILTDELLLTHNSKENRLESDH